MPTNKNGLSLLCRATIQAAEDTGGRRFSIIAYTGEPLKQESMGWDAPVVVDLEGVDLGSGRLPILDNHQAQRQGVIGQSEAAAVEAGQLVLSGPLYASASDAAGEIARLADAGFEWQASIGASSDQKEYIPQGSTGTANGREYRGPCYISRKTTIKEVSFVVIGADRFARALVASGTEGDDMAKPTFAAWCQAKGFKAEELDETQRANMKCLYAQDTEQEEEKKEGDEAKAQDEGGEKKPEEEKKETAAAATLNLMGSDTVAMGATFAKAMRAEYERELKAARKQAAAEAKRIGAINKIAAEFQLTDYKLGDKTVDFTEHAIEAGWTAEKAELEARRVSRPAPALTWYSTSKPEMSDAVIEAAVLQAGRCQLFDETFYGETTDRAKVHPYYKGLAQKEVKARYTDQVQQHAHDLFKGRIGLQQVLISAAQANGKRVPEVLRDDGDIEAVLRANNWAIRAEGASTSSLANLLANVLNKFLLQGYLYTETSWREITSIRAVKDFKATKSINLYGDYIFKQLGPDGHLDNATLSDQAFANQAATYGRIMTITRTHIINDDLGGLTTVPTLMGRGSGLKLNNVFWTKWLAMGNGDDGNAFWGATHTNGTTNYMSSASSALSSTSLTTAVQQQDKQTDPNSDPLGIELEILLYPPELQSTAKELLNAQFLVYGGSGSSTTKVPNTNIWQGAFKPVKSRYLSNSNYTGYSTTAWWLLCNPNVCPVIETCFLNGQETPTVQTAQAEFQTLGISIRGYFDFGVAAQNFRGGQKSAGA